MKKHYLYYSLLIPTVILAIYFSYIIASNPYFHALVEVNEQGDVVITEIEESGVAYELGIQEEDVIHSVNEEKSKDYFKIKRFNRIETVSSIEIQQEKGTNSEIISYKYSSQEIMYYLLFPNAMLLACLILYFVTIRRQTKNKASTLLLFFLLTIGLGYISAGASARGDILARIIASISFILAPVILLNLLFIIFKGFNSKRNWQGFFIILYVISIGLVSATIIHNTSDLLYPYFPQVQIVFISLVILFTMYTLIKTYRQNGRIEAKATIKVLFSGITLSLAPFLLMHAIPILLFNSSFMDPEFALLFLLILPITIFYLLSRERILDIDFLLASLRSNFLYSMFVGIIFYVFSLVQHHDHAVLNSITVTIICLIIFTFKNRVSTKSRTIRQQPNKFFQQQLNQYFNESKEESSPSKLLEIIMNEIQRMIPKIKTVTYFQLQKNTHEVETPDETIHRFIESQAELIIDQQQPIGTIIQLQDGFCIPIHQKGDTLFYLFCSYKIDRTNLNPLENIWLETLAHYSDMLLTNQYTIDNVIQQLKRLNEEDAYYSKWLSKFLFSFSEKERVRLAADIHDSVLQELTLINNGLAAILNEPLTTESSTKIRQVKEQVLDCIFTTRKTCNELVPPFLIEFGLIQATEELIKKSHLEADFHVQFNHEDFNETLLSEDLTVALYRIFQELLTNARKHSNAKTVVFSLELIKDTIKLFYADDGVGLDVSEFETNADSFSGLIGIRERVRSLDGTIKFVNNKGLQVKITLPIE